MDKQFSEHVDENSGVRNLTSVILESLMHVATNNTVTCCNKSMNIVATLTAN